jgi:hypothetical protein
MPPLQPAHFPRAAQAAPPIRLPIMTAAGAGAPQPSNLAVHVVIPTHTRRHLASCLASIALQRVLPSTVVVTCDTDAAEIGEEMDGVWPGVVAALEGRAPPTLAQITRPHQGRAMLNQVRNNGLRALAQIARLRDRDVVLVVDGDTLLAPEAVARHAEIAASGYELCIPYRVNLSEQISQNVSPQSILDAARHNTFAPLVGASDDEALRERDRRYRRQLLLRRILPVWAGVNKPHKPKVLGGHHAVSVRRLRAVNGYDEQYTCYGFDDDDLSRRLHALRPPPRTAIAVRTILAYHLWHPSRAPERPTEAPGYDRFLRDLPISAQWGWATPLPQPEPTLRIISARPAVGAAN